MKFLNPLFLVLFSLSLLSCDSNEYSVLYPEQQIKNSLDSNKIRFDVGIDILDLDDIIVTKTIDGVTGGEITLDTVLTGAQGETIRIQAYLQIDPNSFNDVRQISIIANPNNASIQFFPEMTFNNPVKLDLLISGINLSNLGFDSTCKVDFVYISDDGVIQYILNDEVKIKWEAQELKVTKALLPHFSRYGFVRKCL